MALTRKRRVFVEAYLECWNATEAARQAGYKHPGSQGHRLLKNVEIEAQISQRLAEKVMGANETLSRLSEMARSDVSEFVTEFGVIDWDAVRAKGHLVKRVRHVKGQQSSIELHDAQSALTLIARHHGLLTDKLEHSGVVAGAPSRVQIYLPDNGRAPQPSAGVAERPDQVLPRGDNHNENER
jgi:phage terminase small subunit